MRIPFRFARDRAEIENRKDHPVFDPATGQSPAQLDAALAEIASSGRPHGDVKAEMLAYLLDHAPLELSPCDLFADRIDHGGRIQRYRSQWSEAARAASPENWSETDVGAVCGAYSGDEDFSHTCPDWASLLTLGLPGTVQALEDGRRAADDAHRPFFDRALTVWRAMIRLALRFANAADAYAASHPASACMAENFRAIAARAPQTMYEAMQLVLLVYRMQTHVECENVRSFGRLDVLLLRYPTDDTTDELLRYFFTRLNDFQIDPNLPFTICGIGADGDPAAEALVLRMLRIYGELGNYSPKIQVRLSDRTPESILMAVCRLIRAGSSSFVLCSDRVIVEALVRSGVARADAENYVLIGCYEPGAMGVQTPCTCAGRVSLPKAVETALNGGRDLRTDTLVGLPCADEFADFDAFFAEVVRQGQYFADQSMRRIRAIEACYPEINPSPLYSGGMAVCRAKGIDIYAGGAQYNDTSINVFGTGTAADALAAIRQLVFAEHALTLVQLREILRADWAGQEPLRLRCVRKMPKFGCGDPAVDTVANELLCAVVDRINRQPNGRGGMFRSGAFSVDWCTTFGRLTAASADGRRCGAPLSKNIGAVTGADREGITALVESACAIDGRRLANGTVLDAVLHPSAVAGADGLAAMIGLVRTFIASGGYAIQLNIFDPAVLRDAQRNPDAYRTLQVRVCGWNAYFVDLARAEQDDFIRRSESGAE